MPHRAFLDVIRDQWSVLFGIRVQKRLDMAQQLRYIADIVVVRHKVNIANPTFYFYFYLSGIFHFYIVRFSLDKTLFYVAWFSGLRYPKYLHYLVAQMIDGFHGNAPARRPLEGAKGASLKTPKAETS